MIDELTFCLTDAITGEVFDTEYREIEMNIDLVESAPYNIGTGHVFNGVGGHLFAIAAKASFDNGFEGYITFIPKTELKNYYMKKLGALMTPSGNMYLDTNSSQHLIDLYIKD